MAGCWSRSSPQRGSVTWGSTATGQLRQEIINRVGRIRGGILWGGRGERIPWGRVGGGLGFHALQEFVNGIHGHDTL